MAPSVNTMNRLCRNIVPEMAVNMHKGEAGRIAVVGGSFCYTGAPYYAAESALRTGADLAFVFCTQSAAVPIKSYSPELMVAPILPEESDSGKMDTFDDMLKRTHSVVMGPGLGRDKATLKACEKMLKKVRDASLPIVIDGDALYMVSKNLDLVKGYEKCILTPNPPEFKNLFEAVYGEGSMDKQGDKPKEQQLRELSEKLGNLTIVQKGKEEIIANGAMKETLSFTMEEQSPRRVGGQGDMLSGMIGLFAHWALKAADDGKVPEWYTKDDTESQPKNIGQIRNIMLGCYASSALLKHSAAMAFNKNKRGTVTPHIIEEIHNASQQLYPVDYQAKM